MLLVTRCPFSALHLSWLPSQLALQTEWGFSEEHSAWLVSGRMGLISRICGAWVSCRRLRTGQEPTRTSSDRILPDWEKVSFGSQTEWGLSERKFCLAGFWSDGADLSGLWGLGVLSKAPKRATSDSIAFGPNPARAMR